MRVKAHKITKKCSKSPISAYLFNVSSTNSILVSPLFNILNEYSPTIIFSFTLGKPLALFRIRPPTVIYSSDSGIDNENMELTRSISIRP